eukprot:m.47489 g.47489  ORF g.47489 m.47489 type:complete len:139 (-) comp11922_c0_seq2:44-460(-)
MLAAVRFVAGRIAPFTPASPTLALLRTMATAAGPVQGVIEGKLRGAIDPLVHLDIINESYMHNVPKGSETHFKVVAVSPMFEGMPLIKRHRLVNETLAEELASSVHALSIVARTPAQWEKSSTVDKSPNCLGGGAKRN